MGLPTMNVDQSVIVERQNRHAPLTIILLLIWGLIVLVGFGSLVVYSQTPGAQSVEVSPVKLDSRPYQTLKQWQLVVGIHPKCSCSLATVSELRRLLASAGNDVRCTVYVYAPRQETLQWSDTPLVRTARKIPEVDLVLDPDGETMAQFGILTSGDVVLDDATGTTRFHGGITVARGHEGLNLGSDSILAVINGSIPPASTTHVYGCRINSLREPLK